MFQILVTGGYLLDCKQALELVKRNGKINKLEFFFFALMFMTVGIS